MTGQIQIEPGHMPSPPGAHWLPPHVIQEAMGTDCNKYMKSSLNTRKHFFTVRVAKYWNRVVLQSPSLHIFKTQLDTALSNLLWLIQPEQRGWMR